jgi:hypothetical protein
MVDLRVNQFAGQAFSIHPETLRILERIDALVVPDDPDFLVVPPAAVSIIIIGAVKMNIAQYQSEHRWIVQVLYTSGPDVRMKFFMHHLITLDIKSPVTVC